MAPRHRSPERADSADGAYALPFDVDLPRPIIGINVRTTGVVAFIGEDGEPSDVFVAAGIAFPLRCRRILSAGTTATHIRGLV